MNAGTPLLHLTGQVEKLAGRDTVSFAKPAIEIDLPESRVSTAQHRISNANQAVAILHKGDSGGADAAVRLPVSVESIDIQSAKIPLFTADRAAETRSGG
ncbi:hypothetical protein MJ584_22935 [Klebsiella pneumoniae]|nr:hypothetical protein MJ584_22935 [Klebsiella pneumoniae]